MLTEEQKLNRAKWAAALRSGQYVQTVGGLRTSYGMHCCLGVFCEVMGQPRHRETMYTINGEPYGGFPPAHWFEEKTGFSYPGRFSDLNDRDGLSFDEIADYIESLT
jgi:hypothetical protein